MIQTTINHKFKKGDIVRTLESKTHLIVIEYDFHSPETSNVIDIAYRLKVKNDKHLFTFWKHEHELKLVKDFEDAESE
jgi:hypothetical protein